MLDTFGFPSRFYKKRDDSPSYKLSRDALKNVVAMTCSRSRLQMTACVNGIYDLPDGATTYETKVWDHDAEKWVTQHVDVGNHMEMQDRLYQADLDRFMAQYAKTVMGSGWTHHSKIRQTILDDTPPATDWDVLSGSTNINPTWCYVDAVSSAQTGDVCSQVDSRSPEFDVNSGVLEYAKPVNVDCTTPQRAEIKYWYSASNPYAGTSGITDGSGATAANNKVDADEWATEPYAGTSGITDVSGATAANNKVDADEWATGSLNGSLVAGTVSAQALCDGNKRNIGKIHMDTSIWDITPDCSMVHDQTEDPTYALTKDECPQFNQCSGPDRVSWDGTTALDGRNSPLRERYFWQVPSKVAVQTQMNGVSYECESVGADDTCNALTSANCGDADSTNPSAITAGGPCDATYSRIYLAANPDLTGSECDEVDGKSAKTFFSTHYLKDDGSANGRSSDTSAADHLVCRDGAGAGMGETFWRHHYSTATDIFVTESGGQQQYCDAVYGGPSDDYAKKLAGWLHYRRGSTYFDYDGATAKSVLDTMVGKHCFKTNPCATMKDANTGGSKKQQLVPFHTAYPKVECTSNGCDATTAYDYKANNYYYCEDAPTTAYPFDSDGNADVAWSCSGANCLNEQSALADGYRG